LELTPEQNHNYYFHCPAIKQINSVNLNNLYICPHTVNVNKPSQPLHPPTHPYVFTDLHNHIMTENIPG